MIRSTRAGSNGFVNEVGQAVWSVNPNLPLAGVRTLQEIYDASMARTSFTLVMLAIAGGDGAAARRRRDLRRDLLLGVAAHARDRHPHGAWRAARTRSRGMFVRHGLGLAAIGVACGLVAAVALDAADVVAAVRASARSIR